MRKDKIEHYRNCLLELRDRLKEESATRADALVEKAKAVGDVSDVPTHAADHDVEGLEAEVAVGANQQEIFSTVAHALERIEAGTYGVCEGCGTEISETRLTALPYATLCRNCKQEEEES